MPRFLLFLFIVIPLMTVMAGVLRPDLFVGSEDSNLSEVWQFVGIFLSYLSFVFSVYALMEVRTLSDRSYKKKRLPEVKKNLQSLTRQMSEDGSTKISDFRKAAGIGKVPVLLRQLEKTKVPDFKPHLKRANTLYKSLSSSVSKSHEFSAKMEDLDDYWELKSVLNALIDEIDGHGKDEEARL